MSHKRNRKLLKKKPLYKSSQGQFLLEKKEEQWEWGSFQFDTISFPGSATIQSVQIFVEHHEETGVDAGTIVWKAGQGTIQIPTTLISITAPVNTSGSDVTDVFNVSSVINTSSLVNGLIFVIEDDDSAKKTKIDYIYVEVKYVT